MIYGDAIEEIVTDYIHLRTRLEQEGIKVISNEWRVKRYVVIKQDYL